MNPKLPFVPGMDICGVVEEVAENSEAFKVRFTEFRESFGTDCWDECSRHFTRTEASVCQRERVFHGSSDNPGTLKDAARPVRLRGPCCYDVTMCRKLCVPIEPLVSLAYRQH